MLYDIGEISVALFLNIYYLVMSGLGCGMWDLSLWSMDSLVVVRRLSSCGGRAYLLCGMGDLSSSTRIEAVFPALQGRFLTTEPPEMSQEISVALRNLLQVCIFLSH